MCININNDLEENYVEVGDELHVKCDDSYERLIDKMDQLWDYTLAKKSDYFKIIKCDDDNFIFIEKFNEMLNDTKELPTFGKSCIDENYVNHNSLNLEKDTWRGGFNIGWMYIIKPEVIKDFVTTRNNEGNVYKGLHEDKRFYDLIRNTYPFVENVDLEQKYMFYPYPVYTERRGRNLKRRGNMIYNNISRSTLVTNLNTQQLLNYRFK